VVPGSPQHSSEFQTQTRSGAVRKELFYNPRLLIERVAELSIERRRIARLRGTPAAGLSADHLDSLELLELLRPLEVKVIYDIGANIGSWTLLAKSIFPDATIHSFEPLECHCEEFANRTSGIMGVNLHRVALGSVPDQIDMHVPDRSDASSLLPMTKACWNRYALSPKNLVPVTVERLDDFAHRETLPKADLLKLDIQGFELEALHGATQMLSHTSALLTEVSFVELYKGQCVFNDVVAFLGENGFLVHAFGARTVLGKPVWQADVLFLSMQARKSVGLT
jgi:FkbM family methyltransferase